MSVTPGPWRVRIGAPDDDNAIDIVTKEPNKHWVLARLSTNAFFDGEPDPTIGNARLMAAAPDLAAALEATLKHLPAYVIGGEQERTRKQVLAALAKAGVK